MTDDELEPARQAADARVGRRLPASVRFLFAVIAGAVVAALASYLLRQLGL